MQIEETLNGGYKGLYGEVVTEDCYRLKSLSFVPDLILDIGANVGIFFHHARSIFPDTRIICVEPDDDNFKNLHSFGFEYGTTGSQISLFAFESYKTIFLNQGIGMKRLYRMPGAPNGAHECYLSEGGELVATKAIMLDDLIDIKSFHGKFIVKIDIEGAEVCLWNDKPSIEVLKAADYLTIELHDSEENNIKAVEFMNGTHQCEYVHPYFYATKIKLK